MRILIIEDNSDILANLYGFLEPKGHVLDSATNGYSGLGLASEHEYDVIVLDVMLPGLSGLEFCQRLRTELNRTTPVLMLTARDSLDWCRDVCPTSSNAVPESGLQVQRQVLGNAFGTDRVVALAVPKHIPELLVTPAGKGSIQSTVREYAC